MISNYIDVILRPIDSWTLGWLQCQGQEFNMLQMLHRFQIMRFLLNLKIWNKTKCLFILPLCILTQEQITKALCCAPLHYRVRRPLGRFLSQFFFFKSKVLYLSENIARIANAVQVTGFWLLIDLIVNHYSSMSWFRFTNLSEMVNCVTNSLNHS